MTKPIRVNSRISESANKWLDKRSKETSLSKSAIINLAIENYIKEQEVVQQLPELMNVLHQLEKQGLIQVSDSEG